MSEVELVATLTRRPAANGETVRALSGRCDWLEVRADLTGELEAGWLRERFAGKLLYTLRSAAESGGYPGSIRRRRLRLATAGGSFDLVDLEAERDLSPELLSALPPERRLISWHGPAEDLATLRRRFDRMAETPARLYKLVPAAVSSGDELTPLVLLGELGRRDVVAFAAGAVGSWSRLVAPYLGAPWMYAAAGDDPGAPGQPGLSRLQQDYGLPHLPSVEALYGVVGRPVDHSLSPRLHNGGYRHLELPFLYLPFHVESFGDFWLEVVESGTLDRLGFPLRGLSVTAPFKEVALAVAGATSPLAERINAANTLVLRPPVWEADSTDPEGVVDALVSHGKTVEGRAAVVVGCGGAGRAAAVGLSQGGAAVTLANRGRERGLRAAVELGLPFVALEELRLADFEVVVHATPVGGGGDPGLPFPVDGLTEDMVVVDLAYGDGPTPLLRAAAERGAATVDGREVLLGQARRQFALMTGAELPVGEVRHLLGLEAIR